MEYDDEDPLLNRNRANDLERIKQARKKRIAQLRNWQQYDKMMEKNKVRASKSGKSKHNSRRIHFRSSIVLLEAAAREDIDEVRKILTEGCSPNACNEDGLTALHQACIDNSLVICQLLIQYGADINAVDSELWTPLHAAAACAHIDICNTLIDNGANLLALNAEGNMPYDICEEENTLDLIENAMAVRGISQEEIDEKRKVPEIIMLKDLQDYFSQNGDLSAQDKQGATFLHISASNGFLDVGRFLLDNGVSINQMDKDGWQAVHVAACWGQLEFIELLLMRGANIDSPTKTGETVYEICEDIELNRRLQQIKEEIQRKFELKKSLEVKPQALNRRSNSSKRSASIRRSSMREKSLMSWKEARQEALIREAVQKQISSDPKSDRTEITASDRNLTNGPARVDEINMDQVLIDVQLATESEISQREPFNRRGSTRNSFTHAHPYHSPSRDPSLLEDVVQEEAMGDVSVNSIQMKTNPSPVTNLSVRKTDDSYRSNQSSNNNPSNSVDKNKRSEPNKIDTPPLSRNMDINASINRNKQPISVNESQRKKRNKDNVDNRSNIPLKPQKTQGCCVVM